MTRTQPLARLNPCSRSPRGQMRKKLDQVEVLGFDANQGAVHAVTKGEMVATVLQPIVEGTKKANAAGGKNLVYGGG